MSTIQPQPYFKSVRQFKCSNCAGELTLINRRTNYVGCQYCGAVLDAQSEAHHVITKLNAPSKFAPQSFIRMGMTAVFNGKNHQVLGRTRWLSDYKEYWSEEGETGYSDEKWEYDEWVLMSEEYTYFYLIEDKEGFTLSKSFLPQHPNLPKGTSIQNFTSAKQERVLEYGDSVVEYFEGESTYQIKAGDRVKFAEYKSGRQSHIVEWRLADNRKDIKEIEFFQEELISYQDVVTAFENNESVKQVKNVVAQRNKSKRFWRVSFWLTALAFLVLLIISGKHGNEIFSATYPVPPKNSPADDDDPQLLASTQPIPLQKKNRIYELELSANIPDNSDLWTGVEILNEQGKVINTLEGDFYRASGDEAWQEDGESGIEHWEETETSRVATYRLDEPGTYSARVFASPTSTPNAKVQLKLFEESVLSRYYLIGLIIFTLLALVNSVSASFASELHKQIKK